MQTLPPINNTLFPSNTRKSIIWFWLKYWMWFFLFLPWMLFRQIFISTHHILGVIWTWNRSIDFFDGALRLIFLNNFLSLAVTTVFGERFTAIHYQDVLIDPGPIFGQRRLQHFLDESKETIHAVVVTHSHEEHIGTATFAAQHLGTCIYGTPITLKAIQFPEKLSWARRTFIGQPEASNFVDLRPLSDTLKTEKASFKIIESPGHCTGHASIFEPKHSILFAGDSFLHTIFTSPNRDVSGEEWIKTLERYGKYKILTMIGTHGYIYSIDSSVPVIPFITKRADPNQMIQEKCEFLKWARLVIAEGEQRNLPYSVIEACLFPWQRWWAWYTWFTDESGRLFSAGEFSRTHFVRSLTDHPERVPPRFPPFARFLARLKSVIK